MGQSRRAIAPILLMVAFSSLGSGCATEVKSITSLKVSLESEPGLSPLWLSHNLIGPDGGGAAPLDVYIDGQPALPVANSGNVPAASDAGFSPRSGLTVNSSASQTLFVSGGVHDIGFMRNGELVTVANDVELALDRFNYVAVYGSDSEPAVDVVADRPASEPDGSRRIRIVNLRPDRGAVTFALLDGTGAPIAEFSATLAYGEIYSRSVPVTVSEIAITGDGRPPYSARFTCRQTELLVFNGGPPDFFMPVPVDPVANLWPCATPSCSCPTP